MGGSMSAMPFRSLPKKINSLARRKA